MSAGFSLCKLYFSRQLGKERLKVITFRKEPQRRWRRRQKQQVACSAIYDEVGVDCVSRMQRTSDTTCAIMNKV